MRHKLKLAAIALIALVMTLLASCMLQEQDGYPDIVRFSAEGGEKTVYGDGQPYHLAIRTYDGDGASKTIENDSTTTVVSYQWLTVRTRLLSRYLEIEVQPNPNKGKSRTLYIEAYTSFNKYAGIKVVQK